MLRTLVMLIAAAVIPAFAAERDQVDVGSEGDTCLLISAKNIVTGKGNWFLYAELSDQPYTIQPNDRLEYDILLPALNPRMQGGVDADLKPENLPAQFKSRAWLRDCGLVDQNGITLHGDGKLKAARDQWYHRAFDLAPVTGCTVQRWTVVFEGNGPGRYVQLLDNIRVTRDGRTVCSIYENGKAELQVRMVEGYSRTVLVTTARREDALGDERVVALLEQARRENAARAARDQFHAELDVARALARQLDDQRLLREIEVAATVEDAAAYEAEQFEAYYQSLHGARHRLGHAHPQMQRFTGHLVGHAHIDLQWLWTWDETVNEIIPQTFGQAVKFMQEFPDFTFSQSSAALYVATERHHPKLFKQIQECVAKGQWEVVGGRWCEGDTNMISPESHVRHFLYGQRYFKQKFGRYCTVGWEPDTFGHTWTLPQILRKAGLDSYYFCRAGKDVPLFWWQGPDGSRVLTFEEPATGGWYNDAVSDEKVRELARFAGITGAFDHLMVYGVGNHGGGPTREYIEAALAMRKRGLWPAVKFSTAGEFFRRLHEQAESLHIPTIRDELNPVFEGCYTTHSRIKRYNRNSEALLETAEVFAALAAADGTPYPREAFESMWRDVLWNHHHDTLPGSFIHASSIHSAKMYEALIERGTAILERSQQALAARIASAGNEPCLIVFNPLAWARSEVVEVTLAVPTAMRLTTIVDADGEVDTQTLERTEEGDHAKVRVAFEARGVPGCGWKVLRARLSATEPSAPGADGIVHLVHKTVIDEEYLAGKPPPDFSWTLAIGASFHVVHEKPHGMSAWTLGQFTSTTELKEPVSRTMIESGPIRDRSRAVYRFDESTITQDTITYLGSPRIDFVTTVDWRQTGNADDGGPMLKVAFDTKLSADAATYDIPFGDITRVNDGHENVALKWCAVTGPSHSEWSSDNTSPRTVAILNDCKHAYDVQDGVIRLTLVRSSYEPDPTPDIGVHHMRYAVLFSDGPLDKAAMARAAWEFNKPLQVLVPDAASAADQTGSPLSAAWSGCEAAPENIIVTCLKRAEDNDDFIIRAYECAGRATTATIALGFEPAGAVENDLLEREMEGAPSVTVSGRELRLAFQPYEIRTIRVRP